MNIAIYSRKSKYTGKGESIGNQIEMCKEYINRNFEGDHEITIYEDEGFTGANTNRPEFKRCIHDISNKKFNILICYRLDRISRNVADFSSTLEILEKNNCAFISIKEQFDTSTPMGRAMMYIASVFAQLERETIAERIRDNMVQLAKTGRWLGGTTPTGFESVEVISENKQGKSKKSFMLSPIQDEITTVKLIFDKYLEFKSLTQVETYLLQHHITTKNGSNFTRFTIKTILCNPVYAIADEMILNYFNVNKYDIYSSPEEFNGMQGIMAYNKTIQKKNQSNKLRDTSEWIIAVGKHEGIIEGARWIRVQELLEQNKSKTFRKVRNQDALLSGILRCAKCGSYMRPKMGRTLKDGSNMFYYLCELKEASKKARCDCNNAPGPKMDNTIVEFLKEQSAKKSKVRGKTTDIKVTITEQADKIQNEIALIKQKINENDASIKNLVSTLSLSQNTAAGKYIVEQINKLDDDNANLKEKLYELTQKATVLEYESNKNDIIDDSIGTFGYTFALAETMEERRDAIKRIVDKITWNGKDIDITMIGASHNS